MTTPIPPFPGNESRSWRSWAQALDAAVRSLLTTGGPAGPKGDPGATGPQGPAGTNAAVTDAAVAGQIDQPQTSARLRATFEPADPVLANFTYDPSTGNLLSYQEDGITITMTYNADGTVATSKRGTAPAKTYSYSGGNLVGVA